MSSNRNSNLVETTLVGNSLEKDERMSVDF